MIVIFPRKSILIKRIKKFIIKKLLKNHIIKKWKKTIIFLLQFINNKKNINYKNNKIKFNKLIILNKNKNNKLQI